MSCPICRKETVIAYRPFCSKRCADVDLGRWLTGAYVIPVEVDDESDNRPATDPDFQSDPGKPH